MLGRDDPKDIFDLYTIFCLEDSNWSEIMSAAAKKCALDVEELRFRLESFPFSMIDILPVIEKGFSGDLQRDYRKMVACLLAAV